jgi:hypothetical protein
MASYDSTLLASAPAATKTQLQEGYTTDLLEKPTASPAHSRPDLHDGRDSTSGTPNHQRDLERQQAFAAAPPTKVPWYRTTKGLIILAVAFVVIIAAAVGGGVGGSKKKHNNSDATVQGAGGGGASQGGAGAPAGNSTTAASGSSTTDAPSQGGGQVPSGTPTPTADPSQGGGQVPSTTGSPPPITFAPLPSIFSNQPPNPITTPVVPPGQAASG